MGHINDSSHAGKGILVLAQKHTCHTFQRRMEDIGWQVVKIFIHIFISAPKKYGGKVRFKLINTPDGVTEYKPDMAEPGSEPFKMVAGIVEKQVLRPIKAEICRSP